MARSGIPLQLRLPANLKAFIEREAKRNYTSQNAEICRAVRERMEREESPEPQADQRGSA